MQLRDLLAGQEADFGQLKEADEARLGAMTVTWGFGVLIFPLHGLYGLYRVIFSPQGAHHGRRASKSRSQRHRGLGSSV